MVFLVIFFIEVLITAMLAGALCGSLGVYLERMRLLTISFTIAHAALAGAAISIIFKVNPELTAFFASITAASLLEIAHSKLNISRELISMAIFSFSSAIAMLAIYLTPSVTLTSEVASLVLWGSVLATSLGKILLLVFLLLSLIIYVSAFRIEINTILFDKKLAEAEGVNVNLHATILIILTASSISVILKLTGAFLVFALLFNPSMSSIKLTYRRQPLIGALLGALAGGIGVFLSFYFDTPIGATISISSSVILFASILASIVKERKLRQKILSKHITQLVLSC